MRWGHADNVAAFSSSGIFRDAVVSVPMQLVCLFFCRSKVGCLNDELKGVV